MGRWMWQKAILFYSDNNDPPNEHISHPPNEHTSIPYLMCPRKITLEMLRYQPYQKRCGHKEPLSRGQHTCYIKKRWKAQYGKPNILQLKINKFNLIKTFSFP